VARTGILAQPADQLGNSNFVELQPALSHLWFRDGLLQAMAHGSGNRAQNAHGDGKNVD
jgi:hypothetical protein